MPMTEQIKILNHLKLNPEINSLQISREKENLVATINFQLNAKDDSKTNAWFLDKKIISFINLKIICCFTRGLHNELVKNPIFLFKGIPNGLFPKEDYQIIEKKITPSSVNIFKTTDNIISTSFSNEIKRENKTSFFSIFLAASIDNNEIANKYNINNEKLKFIVGTHQKEIFIENDQIVNQKVLDITVFKQKEKLEFNLKFIDDILSTKISSHIILNPNNNHFSSVDYSFNENNDISLLYSLKIDNLMKERSRYKFFFENAFFIENFYKNKENFLPQHIVFKRIDLISNKTDTLYDGKFIESYSSNDVSFDLLKFNTSTIWLGAKDKTSKRLKNRVKYQLELTFEDKTISFLEDIKNSILEELNKIETIINFAHFGNYFQQELNYFKPSLYEDLKNHNLSIQGSILTTAKILSQFRNFSNDSINSIIQLSKSQFFNLEILESIRQILSYLKSETTLLQNNILARTNKIIVDNISQEIELDSFQSKVSVFETNQSRSIAQISSENLIERLNIENSKYYKTNNIENKNLYFTPMRLISKDKSISQNNKIDQLDFESYNELLINVYYLKIFERIPENLSNYEKLIDILFYYGITFELGTEEGSKTNEVPVRLSPSRKAPVSRAKILDEKTLLYVFLKSIAFKNAEIFSYKNINPKSDSTKKQLIDLNKIPVQSRAIIESFENNQFTRLNNEEISKNIDDIFRNFALYLNFKHVYKIEYLEEDSLQWKELSVDKIKNNELICRYIPFYDENLNIKQDLEISFTNANDIFILSNNSSIGVRGQVPTQKDIPFLEDIYALYPFGSMVYGTDRDSSDFDFILVTKKDKNLTNNVIIHNNFSYTIVSYEQYLKDLMSHEIYALETYFLPESAITVRPASPWPFRLNVAMLKESIKKEMEKNFRKTEERFKNKESLRAIKTLFYGIRAAVFAKQIINFRKITNYAAADSYWEELKSINETNWAQFRDKYRKLYSSLYLSLGN